MIRFIDKPETIRAEGRPPKEIQEYVGRVRTQTAGVSIARMISPAGWSEPAQTPEFNEYSLVLKGALYVKQKDNEMVVRAGQAIMVTAGETVQYSTPEPEGAEYIAVCEPAFSPATVHRRE